jgi:SAM-dependent methyltransferase
MLLVWTEPGTMPETRTLDDLLLALRGFQESRVLLTAIELDVFARVGDGATAEAVAAGCGTDARATAMLLNALVALGALAKEGDRFRGTAASAALAEGRAGLMHTVRKWDSWSTLTECVRRGTTLRDRGRRRDEEGTEAFIGAMRVRALPVAARLAGTLGAGSVRRMLDIGGGPATFAIAFAEANPHLRAEVLDLEDVVPIARRHIREAGLGDRVTARVGDLRSDTFGQGYDLILASAVCHMISEAENQDLFRRCAAALVPGGRLAIREFILEPDRTAPREAALFALNMLAATARGNVYTEAEYRRWLRAAGFGAVERHRNGEDLLVATLA